MGIPVVIDLTVMGTFSDEHLGVAVFYLSVGGGGGMTAAITITDDYDVVAGVGD